MTVSDHALQPASSSWADRYVVAVGGLVATGKSTFARALAARLEAALIEADPLRNDVLVRDHTGDRLANLTPSLEDEVYAELLSRGERELEAGQSLVLDGCFPRRQERLAARRLARSHGRTFVFVECRVSDDVARKRLAARDQVAGRAGWQEIYDALAAHFEAPDELEPGEHLVVRGDGPVEDAVDDVVAALQRIHPPPGAAALALRPDAVTFDCWNTLLVEDDWHLAHALRVEALRNAAVQAGADVTRDQAGRAFDGAWQQHMQAWAGGRATGAREVARAGLQQLGLAEPHPALDHLIDHFETASHSSRVRALEGARETLVALRDADISCALICDTGLTPGRVVREHLGHLGLLEYLSVQVFSDEAGAPKPDLRVFRAALEPLGVSPGKALHVGDLLRTDVGGARAAGMTSVRIRASHDDTSDLPEADFVVQSHADLRALLLPD